MHMSVNIRMLKNAVFGGKYTSEVKHCNAHATIRQPGNLLNWNASFTKLLGNRYAAAHVLAVVFDFSSFCNGRWHFGT